MANNIPSSLSTGTIYLPDQHPFLGCLRSTDRDRVDASKWLPLVLYGEPGCGKSFLALAFAEQWMADQGADSVLVTSAADVQRLFARSTLAAEVDAAYQRYRSVPLLVLDDVHQLAERAAACQWLVGVLEHRTRQLLPSVITGSSITALRQLPPMLASRLLDGLPLPLSLPDAPTRSRILHDCCSRLQLSLSPEQIASLVQKTAGLSVSGTQQTVRIARHQELSLPQSSNQEDLPNRCIAAVAKRFGLRMSDIRGASRRKNTVLARSVAMFLIREHSNLSLLEIGACFQKRDHTTVRHACEKIRKLLKHDDFVQAAVRSACATLQLAYQTSWSCSKEQRCA